MKKNEAVSKVQRHFERSEKSPIRLQKSLGDRHASLAMTEGNGCTAETYSDYGSADAETQQYMLEACAMGLMGRDGQ